MRGQLIPDWPLAWKFSSVQAAALLAVLSAVQAEVLPMVQPIIPEAQWPLVSGGLALAIIVLRLRAQPALEPQRQQLQLDREAAQPAADAAQVDARVESMAWRLYLASNPSKPWAQVSPASKARWRQVAAAALEVATAPGAVADTAAGAGEEHF